MSEVYKTPTLYVAMAGLGKFIENYGRPGDILTHEEIHRLLGLPVTNQCYKNTEGFKMSKEKLEKLEKLENNFLEAFRKYEEAKKELRLATGWSFEMSQNILCSEEDVDLRDDLYERMRTIAKEYITKR